MKPDLPLGPVHALAKAHFGKAPSSATEMPGGASLRRFFRLHCNGSTAVGMYFPNGAESEEVEVNGNVRRDWPFVEVAKLLSDVGVRVPRILGTDYAQGWLLVEDLGDATLAETLSLAPERKTTLYQTAVRDLALAQSRLQSLPIDCVVNERRFDQELLTWEISHFREWYWEAQGVVLTPGQAAEFDDIATKLAQLIAGMEYGFVHRDYQSRNLMVVGEQSTLAWVDFQDALIGPRVYDLVALLGDSYQSFELEFVRERLREFCALRSPTPAWEDIWTEFNLVTVQRKLKDAGRFVYIDRVKGDSSFLRFVEPTLDRVFDALSRIETNPLMAQLKALLLNIGRAKAGGPTQRREN